jgi:hypothetical protein
MSGIFNTRLPKILIALGLLASALAFGRYMDLKAHFRDMVRWPLKIVCFDRFGCNGNWPLEPFQEVHGIGNTAGEFQQSGQGSPYFHMGLDIMDQVPATNAFALTQVDGIPIQIPTSTSYCANKCQIQLLVDPAIKNIQAYVHLEWQSLAQSIRDAHDRYTTNNDDPNARVRAGSQISKLYPWPSCGYTHLHFEDCDDAGCTDPAGRLFPMKSDNALELKSITFWTNDSNPPTTRFPSAGLFPGINTTTVSGAVDIIVEANDRNHVKTGLGMMMLLSYKTGVWKARYEIRDAADALVKSSTMNFDRVPTHDDDEIASSVFFDSKSDYCTDEHYSYIVTNVACESSSCEIRMATVDAIGKQFAWDTTRHPNGNYVVTVTVEDFTGNALSRTERVMISN